MQNRGKVGSHGRGWASESHHIQYTAQAGVRSFGPPGFQEPCTLWRNNSPFPTPERSDKNHRNETNRHAPGFAEPLPDLLFLSLEVGILGMASVSLNA